MINNVYPLTYCGLVEPYGDIDLGQHWVRYWLCAWQHQAITWTNVVLSSKMFCDIHFRTISQEMIMNLDLCNTYSVITLFNGDKELKHSLFSPKYSQNSFCDLRAYSGAYLDIFVHFIDVLMQKRCNSIANTGRTSLWHIDMILYSVCLCYNRTWLQKQVSQAGISNYIPQ